MTEFEPVEKGGGETDGEEFISISPNGMFYIPNRVYERYFDGVGHVELGRNVETKRIALRPTSDPEGSNIYELKDNRGYGKRFSSREAITELGVDLDSSIRLEPEWATVRMGAMDEESKAVVLSLSEVDA